MSVIWKTCYSISGDVAVRQKYKQYESDSSVPVPKSTKFWRKRKLRYLNYHLFTVKWENTAHYKFKRLWHNTIKINSGPTVFHMYLISSSYKTITSVLFFYTRVMCLRNFRRSILFINTITEVNSIGKWISLAKTWIS